MQYHEEELLRRMAHMSTSELEAIRDEEDARWFERTFTLDRHHQGIEQERDDRRHQLITEAIDAELRRRADLSVVLECFPAAPIDAIPDDVSDVFSSETEIDSRSPSDSGATLKSEDKPESALGPAGGARAPLETAERPESESEAAGDLRVPLETAATRELPPERESESGAPLEAADRRESVPRTSDSSEAPSETADGPESDSETEEGSQVPPETADIQESAPGTTGDLGVPSRIGWDSAISPETLQLMGGRLARSETGTIIAWAIVEQMKDSDLPTQLQDEIKTVMGTDTWPAIRREQLQKKLGMPGGRQSLPTYRLWLRRWIDRYVTPDIREYTIRLIREHGLLEPDFPDFPEVPDLPDA